MPEERLQKFLARAGVASRRACEKLLAERRVTVNGEIVDTPGVKIDPARDRVNLDGKPIRANAPARYILLHKIRGVTTTAADELGRRTVLDLLPPELTRQRIYPVGRLDRDSEGLLLLTNDGELANRLTHPAFGITKTYRATLEGLIDAEVLRQLAAEGIRLGPVLVKPRRVELVRHENDVSIVLITVAEGINREIRRVFAALGHEVKRLIRLEIGPLSLQSLRRGHWRELTAAELARLRRLFDEIGADAVDPEAAFPPGSASARKPAGPRGRPTRPRPKAPRLGKPDPALHAPRPATTTSTSTSTSTSPTSSAPAASSTPEFPKTISPRKTTETKTRPSAAYSPRPLRPRRAAPASSSTPTATPTPTPFPPQSAAPAGPSAPVAHPLFAAARPAPGSAKNKPGAKGPAKKAIKKKTSPSSGIDGSGKRASSAAVAAKAKRGKRRVALNPAQRARAWIEDGRPPEKKHAAHPGRPGHPARPDRNKSDAGHPGQDASKAGLKGGKKTSPKNTPKGASANKAKATGAPRGRKPSPAESPKAASSTKPTFKRGQPIRPDKLRKKRAQAAPPTSASPTRSKTVRRPAPQSKKAPRGRR